ncbi:MAG: acetate--CoA ligase family protein [Desulfomicrobium sp.]|nr:acetate--CoA ligase family protein [Pseudomonadota bacterium]MBV1714237.1 acetate--CoA ligase family protein [Desulfomicrobium sp.]MBU4570976.1 acetate--CoA ligase family protein [Pseudomonadota bacterium]MBU4594594.1 acetate--CoA ligase family protein [Pseudomonadota bacterium]MBV1721777.1 acetate--CoA ligase family protein [Desulfomicrobium sp.]
MRDDYLHALFSPKAIAVVGIFDSAGALARVVLSNLEGWGYQGRIVPVNWATQLEPQTVDSLTGIDLAVVCLSPEHVLEALELLADKGVKAVIITSAGFREIGGQGYYLEEAVIQLAARRNLTLLGPNCLGVASWEGRMNASLISRLPTQGNIAFFSPSGSMCNAILDWAASEAIGFSKFASLGNRAVIDEASMLQFLADDAQTSVIIGYLEGMNNGRRFARISQTITREKPVIMLQAGMTEHGQKAISSHVGALTGSERAYQTALKQAGIIQVDNLSTLFDLARMFGTQPLPNGPNLAIVTNSGGAGILAADGMAGTSLILPRFGGDTAARLAELLPRHAQSSSLVDIGMEATPVQYAKALEAVLRDRQVQMALVVIAPGLGVDLPAIVRELVAMPRVEGKPVAVCLIGQEGVMEEKRFLQRSGLPCYANPKAALSGFEAMLRYAQWKTKSYPVEVCYRRDKAKAERFLEDCLAASKTELFGFEAQPLLMAYELSFPRTELARTSRSAVKIAKRLACPVALKIASPHIEYKSDVDGVEVNLHTSEEVRQGFMNLTSRVQRQRSEAFISGCLVQEMILGKPAEVCIRAQRDPKFGPLIRFSVSGSQADIFQEYSMRLAPLSLEDAAAMMRELKVFSLLKRERGRDALDLRALEDVLLTVSQMTLDFPEIYTLEFDPVLVTSRGAWVAGVRMSLLPLLE